jgi:hypothetical protein
MQKQAGFHILILYIEVVDKVSEFPPPDERINESKSGFKASNGVRGQGVDSV